MTNAKRGIWTTEIDGESITFKFGVGTLMRVREEPMSHDGDFMQSIQNMDFEALVLLLKAGYNEAVRLGYQSEEIDKWKAADLLETLTPDKVNSAFEVLFECEFFSKAKEQAQSTGGESGKLKKTGKKPQSKKE